MEIEIKPKPYKITFEGSYKSTDTNFEINVFSDGKWDVNWLGHRAAPATGEELERIEAAIYQQLDEAVWIKRLFGEA